MSNMLPPPAFWMSYRTCVNGTGEIICCYKPEGICTFGNKNTRVFTCITTFGRHCGANIWVNTEQEYIDLALQITAEQERKKLRKAWSITYVITIALFSVCKFYINIEAYLPTIL